MSYKNKTNHIYNPTGKKTILLQMAKNGEKRPSKKAKLGQALSCYTIKTSKSYDPEFDKEIRTLRHDWFISQSDTADNKKRQLLKMAKNREKRPSQKTKLGLGSVLCHYTIKTSKSYDPEFDKKLRTIRPDWFVSRSDIANEKKKQLLEMAKNGEKRPSQKTKLGIALFCYISKNNTSYDPEFNKQIKTLRPDWFRNKIINN